MSFSVPLSNVASYIAECQKNDGFKNEFSALLAFDNSLKKDQLTNFPTALKYSKKNRWTDGGFEVYPNENSRIKLPTNDTFQYDYINANFIPKSITGSSCDYIATQAPMIDWIDGNTEKEDTMNDFWNMIWLNNVPVIVMLAKLIEEEEKIKAHQYWPDVNAERVYSSRTGSNIIVTGIREYLYNNDSDIIIREMTIRSGDLKRTIHQVHFMGWPDNSVPTKHDGFVNVLLAADELMKDRMEGPMTVHCSAGVGRTGTYILIHTLFQKLKEHHESETTEPFELNIFDTVLDLKHLRWQLVYNVAQYEFCYRGTLFLANRYLGRGSCDVVSNDNY